ncbi:MAG: peptide chain release factor 3, partial [Actinobacteria bacterium]|nr:peptide chain release factor 3 [Actinomycetota bacterium]
VLQFEVASWRLEHEFGAPVRLEPTSRSVARRTDEGSVPAFSAMSEVEIYRRSDDTPLVLFRDRFQLERIERQHPDLTLDVIVNG